MKNLPDSDKEFKDFEKSVFSDKSSNHVFKISVIEFDRQYKSVYPKIVSAMEFAKAERFIHPVDAQRYLVSKFVLRQILSGFLMVPPAEIQFRQTAKKKPCIDGIEFNVSHSGNYILIAIGPAPIGIDIEMIKPDFDFKSLLNDFFNVDEHAYIENQHNRSLGFYWLWTRKEAILKATGEGLTDHMNLINSIPDQVFRNEIAYNVQSFIQEKQYIWSLAVKEEKPLLFWNYNLS